MNHLYKPAVVTHINDATFVLLEGNEQDVRQQISCLSSFVLCDMPELVHSLQMERLHQHSHDTPHSIERSIRKQFDPSNKLNKHIATQRDLLT